MLTINGRNIIDSAKEILPLISDFIKDEKYIAINIERDMVNISTYNDSYETNITKTLKIKLDREL